MKLIYTLLVFCFVFSTLSAQYAYEPSKQFPYGSANPDAPKEIKDFQPLVGKCICSSSSRNQDGTWADSIEMTWVFKYIMNGMAVQDLTLKSDGIHSGSIRQYNQDSAAWYVHYYSNGSAVPTLPSWKGGMQENDIVLFRDSPAPNGTPGDYRLTFYDINPDGFKWIGEWVNKGRTIVYPTWKIQCKKEEE